MVTQTRNGRGHAATITVRQTDWDELRVELAVRHAEALDHVARLAPIHSRLYSVTSYVSPEAARLVGLAMGECESYRRRQGDR
jgi:hypothetical protein